MLAYSFVRQAPQNRIQIRAEAIYGHIRQICRVLDARNIAQILTRVHERQESGLAKTRGERFSRI